MTEAGGGVLAVRAGTVITGDERAPLHDVVIVAEGGRISAVIPSGTRDIDDRLAGAQIIDASDRWVIPGLIEGHAHVTSFASAAYHPDDAPPYFAAPALLTEFIRRGITTIRDTGGPELAALHTLQTHDQPWPSLLGSGPNLDGLPGGPWKGMWKTEDVQEAIAFTEREADAGVDFVKVYAWMSREVMTAVVRTAHRRGLRVAAHLGHRVSVLDAIEIGVDALEHVRLGPELLDDAARKAYRELPSQPHSEKSDTRAWRFLDPDGDAVGVAIDRMVESGVHLVPTLAVHEASLDPYDGYVVDETVSAAIGAHHDAVSQRVLADADEARANAAQFARMVRFVGRAAAAGVRICVGSDTPSASVPPGQGTHREMELLHTAGMSTADVLRAATGTTASLLGRAAEFGTISGGSRADLVVLDRDPLADISATTAIGTVILGGAVVTTATTTVPA
jgi:imidazolonepropionase-like amidohydrolase